jgi:hypothetical protein
MRTEALGRSLIPSSLSSTQVTAYQVGAKSGKVNVDEINAQLHTALKQ